MSEPFISELRLQNFKCYEDLTLQLKAGVNLLYGLNGSGKTAILEGLNVAAASLFMEWATIHNVDKRKITSEEVRLKTPAGMQLPEYQWPVSISAVGDILGQPTTWSRELNSFSGGITAANAVDMRERSREAALIAQNGRRELLPVIAFFSTNRLFVGRSETPNLPIGRFKGYFNAVTDSHTQKQIRAWLKDAEYIQYQDRQSNPEFIDLGLQGLKNVVLSLFEGKWDEFYYFEPSEDTRLPKGIFLKSADAPNSRIPETSLSDGYRNFFWLFLEIAWRCYMLNPYLKDHAASETNGIVMIDEVELHLHPEWQQKILGLLSKAFPKIQFVVTTHSPIVLGSVKAGQVILLKDQSATAYPAPYGLTPSYILKSYMGIEERLPELREDIRRYFELINQGLGKGEEALSLRARLDSVMSPDDPIFVEAESLLYYLA